MCRYSPLPPKFHFVSAPGLCLLVFVCVSALSCSPALLLSTVPHHPPPLCFPPFFAPLTHISITCERVLQISSSLSKNKTKQSDNKQKQGQVSIHPYCHAPSRPSNPGNTNIRYKSPNFGSIKWVLSPKGTNMCMYFPMYICLCICMRFII